jgi:hypothetical protein
MTLPCRMSITSSGGLTCVSTIEYLRNFKGSVYAYPDHTMVYYITKQTKWLFSLVKNQKIIEDHEIRIRMEKR